MNTYIYSFTHDSLIHSHMTRSHMCHSHATHWFVHTWQAMWRQLRELIVMSHDMWHDAFTSDVMHAHVTCVTPQSRTLVRDLIHSRMTHWFNESWLINHWVIWFICMSHNSLNHSHLSYSYTTHSFIHTWQATWPRYHTGQCVSHKSMHTHWHTQVNVSYKSMRHVTCECVMSHVNTYKWYDTRYDRGQGVSHKWMRVIQVNASCHMWMSEWTNDALIQSHMSYSFTHVSFTWNT